MAGAKRGRKRSAPPSDYGCKHDQGFNCFGSHVDDARATLSNWVLDAAGRFPADELITW